MFSNFKNKLGFSLLEQSVNKYDFLTRGIKKFFSNGSGFTLIELILVIVVVGVILTISFPQFNKSYRYRIVKDTAGKIQNFLKYIQTKAKVERKDCKVVFDSDNNRYWYIIDVKDKERISKKYKVSSLLELENKGDKEIWFYPDRTSSGQLSLLIKDSKGSYIFSLEKEEGISRIEIKEEKSD